MHAAQLIPFSTRPNQLLDHLMLLRNHAVLTSLGVGGPMHAWEYSKIDLSNLPRRTEDIDLLNGAGSEGWEVVAITNNGIAYLKRLIHRAAPATLRAAARAKVTQT